MGVSIEVAKDLTWSDFLLQSHRYEEDRKFKMLLTREISYQVYCGQFTMSKNRPKSKKQFWPVGRTKKGPTATQVEAFRIATENFRKTAKKNKEKAKKQVDARNRRPKS